MTQKKKAFIEAICDEYWFDYPETDQEYEEILDSYNFKSWCYVKDGRLSLAKVIEIADSMGLLEDDDY